MPLWRRGVRKVDRRTSFGELLPHEDAAAAVEQERLLAGPRPPPRKE